MFLRRYIIVGHFLIPHIPRPQPHTVLCYMHASVLRKLRKWGCCAPFLGGRGTGYPSNTIWPGPSPTPVPSAILFHPTVWPQYTNIRDEMLSLSKATKVDATDN